MADVSSTQPIGFKNISPTSEKLSGGYRDAFLRVLNAAEALEEADLITVNIDVAGAVTTALGSLPEIMALRGRVEALPELDLTQVDNLGTYARATMHAHGEYLAASAPPKALAALNSEGTALRNTLYLDALVLTRRDLLNGGPLKEFKNNVGYKNLAVDLVGLSSLLRNAWPQIGNKTGLSMDELERAAELSEKLLTAVGVREQAPIIIAEAARVRQRVFTLFVQAYSQARRVVCYLRWNEGDLDTIAPSLYAGRNKRRGERPKQEVTSTPPPVAAPGVSGSLDVDLAIPASGEAVVSPEPTASLMGLSAGR